MDAQVLELAIQQVTANRLRNVNFDFMTEYEHTETFKEVVFQDAKRVLVYDWLNERDCWLPKFYRDGRPLIHIEELTRGVEITMPEWLAKERELI